MGWTTDGYVPDDFSTIMSRYFNAFKNEYEPNLTEVRFKGSREYELFYSSAQVDMQIQTIFADSMEKVSDWILSINLKIQQPSTVPTAIVKAIKDNFGFNASVKPMIEADAGKLHIAIDYTPTTNLNTQIAQVLATQAVAGGIVTIGDISVPVSVGGQQFDYKWTAATEANIKFKLTITVSRSAATYIESEANIKERFLKNFNDLYQLGYDIEPESYFEIVRDAQYASNILCEYSLNDGSTWASSPLKSLFNTKYVPELDTGDVKVVRP